MKNSLKHQIRDVERELIELRGALSSETSEYGDYRIIKTFEAQLKGDPDIYNITPIMEKREKMRLRINELEAKMAELTGVPLEVNEEEEHELELAQLDSGYERAKQQLREAFIDALMLDDTETQEEIKAALADLNNQYDKDRESVEGEEA